MKRSEKRNLRLRYLLIILLITAIVFVSSTYAWFTTNRTVTVSEIDVHVETVAGLQISVDGVNWKSTISKDDLLTAINTYNASINTIPSELEPVSSAMEFDTIEGNEGQLQMYYGKVEADNDGVYRLTTEKNAPNAENTHYIVFDIFLKTTADIPEGELYLTKDSGASCNGQSVGLENASRIAFVKQGNIADGSDKSDIQSLVTDDVNNVYLWEPHYKSHTAAAVSHASATYGIVTTTNPSNNNRIPYSGAASAVTSGILLKDATQAAEIEAGYTTETARFKDVTPTYTTATGTTSNLPIFGLDAGITKVRVYMWIEGQDVDCENNASGTDIQFNLKFTIDA